MVNWGDYMKSRSYIKGIKLEENEEKDQDNQK